MCLFILVPKLQQTLPESRFALNKGDSISAASEKNPKAEPKAEAGAKARSSSNTPTSPKPPLQSTKPSLAGRPTVPQKPRSASRTGEELFWAFVTMDIVCYPQLGTSEWRLCGLWRRHPWPHPEQKLNVEGRVLQPLALDLHPSFPPPSALIQINLLKWFNL